VTSLFAILAVAFLYGLRHATDPDHVIAVTTIVSRQRSMAGAIAIGAAWGLGHTLTILVVGMGIIIFGWVIPPRIGLSTELSVGVMLIILGIMALTTRQDHAHEHQFVDRLDHKFGALGPYRLVRPLVVGIVHGLAGSAAVALLVLAAIHNPRWAMLYLLVFGLGTIVAMMLMTAVIVVPFAYTEVRLDRLNRRLRLASGAISLAFGLFIAYRIGIVDGLFTGAPHWTPQ
jgi:sulfite exporter TauE/SafE